jgi:hypothetical protein
MPAGRDHSLTLRRRLIARLGMAGICACLLGAVGATPGFASATITSMFATTAPRVDGQIDVGEYPPTSTLSFPHGTIFVSNDAARLYMLLDVTGDTGNDPPWNAQSGGDYFWVSFDTNRDHKITPKVDLNYSFAPSTTQLRYQLYLGPNRWTPLQPAPILSSSAMGFGCFFADHSLSFGFPFPFLHCSAHRLYELAFDLNEIGAKPGGSAFVGVRVASKTPSFVDDTPAGFSGNFSDLVKISLAPPAAPLPTPSPGATAAPDTNPLELTQAIQTRADTLALVDGKTTAARVYVKVSGGIGSQPALVYLYARRNGSELPGSPVSQLLLAAQTVNRDKFVDTANFLLPRSWATTGTQFQVRIRDFNGHDTSAPAITPTFVARRPPIVWVVPVNNGTSTATQLASQADIDDQESYMRTAYPVPNVLFVQKPWQAIGALNSTSLDTAISSLNTYHTNAVIAWIISVLFTGQPPYDLPDQIYGVMSSGGGLSDPVWAGGQGYVAAGWHGTSLEGTMAHEINHNLDRSSTGTWGRHVSGCGAIGPDPNWPYSTNAIQETGFDTRLPWVDTTTRKTVVPSTTPDFMTYCQSGILPTKWISPYRWTNLLSALPAGASGVFRSQAAAGHFRRVLYISGELNSAGTGRLDPIIVAPGVFSEPGPRGRYSVELVGRDGEPTLTRSFVAMFRSVEGRRRREVGFNLQLPAEPETSAVVLRRGRRVLDRIDVTLRPPSVRVIAPNGGERFGRGSLAIRWRASDPDSRVLSFSIMYSPDAGRSWFPVAANIHGRHFQMKTALVPGGARSMIRVAVTDGYNTVDDDSDRSFRLAPTAPDATILQPASGSRFGKGRSIVFQGAGTSADGEPLAQDALVWFADSRPLGIGQQIQAALPVGRHRVTLRVFDTNGTQSQASIRIRVTRRRVAPG